jgi:hypothetical protein
MVYDLIACELLINFFKELQLLRRTITRCRKARVRSYPGIPSAFPRALRARNFPRVCHNPYTHRGFKLSRTPNPHFPPGHHDSTPPRLTMAPKRSQARESTTSATAKAQSATASGPSTPSRPAVAAAEASASKSSVKFSANQSPQEVALGIWKNYLDTTPQRTKLIDVFIAFLVVVGVLQFVYCVLVGNYVCCPLHL